MKSSFDGQKPEISYPCTWSYQLIGVDETRVREAVSEVIGQAPYTLAAGRVSSGGKYRSLALETRVADERERLRIFERLSKHPAIRFVI